MAIRFLILLFICTPAFCDNYYFEPTCEQIKKEGEQIHAQQLKYLKAKRNRQYAKAKSYALYHFQKAWLELRLANELIDLHEYNTAVEVLKRCVKECTNPSICDPGFKHLKEQKKCLRHAKYDLNMLRRKLSGLEESGD